MNSIIITVNSIIMQEHKVTSYISEFSIFSNEHELHL